MIKSQLALMNYFLKCEYMYQGYQYLQFDSDQLANLYSNPETLNLLENEYVLVENDNGEIIDKVRYSNRQLIPLKYPNITNKFLGKVKPRNPEQHLTFDLLQNTDITVKVLTGPYGSGKDFCMIACALDLIDKGIYDRIVYVRNNVEVKDTVQLGALPGGVMEKILPFVMPFCDHVGGVEGLQRLVESNRVEVQHLGYIRGRDIKNAIILSSEAENLTKEHVQLLIGRVGEGSALWLNGDHRQTDKEIFKSNSGLRLAVEKLKGNPLFGYVHLTRSERSETSRLADLLDR